MVDKRSQLINIPKGTMFWDEPLMKNLQILEEMIYNVDSGGGSNIHQIQRQIDEIREQVNELGKLHRDDIAAINQALDKIEKQLDKVDVEYIDKSIREIEEKIKDINGDMVALQKKVTTLSVDVQSHAGQLNANSLAINELQNDVTESVSVIVQMQHDIEEVRGRLDNLEDGSGGLPAAWVDKVEGHLESLQDWQDDTELMLVSLNDTVSNIEEDMGDLTAAQDELTVIVDDMESAVSSATGLVLNLQDSVEDLESFKESSEEDIDSLKLSVRGLEVQVRALMGIELQFDFVVDDITGMNNISTMVEGSMCYIRKTEELFVYDSKWIKITGGIAGGTTSNWEDIVGRPKSTSDEIDEAVGQRHVHPNKDALDRVSNSKMMSWDGKAEQKTVDAVKNTVEELQNDVDKINLLSSENKDEIVKMSELIEEMSKNMIYISEE